MMSPQAPAEPAPDADTLHRLATEALRAGEVEQAEAHLTALWAIERSARAACDLGLTFSIRENWPEAAAMMERCVEFAAGRTGERIQEAHRAAMKQVQRVEVVISPDGAQVEVAGAARGDRALYVAPGPYQLVASHPGYVTVTRQLTAVAGARVTEELTLEAAQPATASTPAAPKAPAAPDDGTRADEPDYSARNWVVIGAGVAAVGSVVAALVFDSSASSEQDRYHELDGGSCRLGDHRESCVEAGAAADDWRSAISTRNVFYGVGAGFAVLGVAAYFLWPASDSSTARVTPSFNVSADGGQWSILGRF